MSSDSLPVVPVVFRTHFDKDSRRWYVVAVFPTIAAESSDWFRMQAFDFGADGHCAADPQRFAKGRPSTPEEVAEHLPRLRAAWESDPDFPCELKVYRRIQSDHRDTRRRDWRKSRDHG